MNKFDTTVDPGYLIVAKRLDEIRAKAKVVSFNDDSKLLFLGDLHAGLGKFSKKDDFWKNYPLCLDTLRDYRGRGFHVIGPGDLFELWEQDDQSKILAQYPDLFDLFDIMLGGNHDWSLNNPEAILLRHSGTWQEILVCHGHQRDPFCDQFWQVGKWITQNWGKAQELLGVSDPTAWKMQKHEEQEEKLIIWSEENISLIAGHTHRPVMKRFENGNFFADGGSWVGAGGQATMIENGQIEVRTFS